MDTKLCSELIVRMMRDVDAKIETLDRGSVNKDRLHSHVHTQLMISVKNLYGLPEEESKKYLDHIFKTELNSEILRMRAEADRKK